MGTGLPRHPMRNYTHILMKTGGKCGATFIDRNFITWLKQKLGPQDSEAVIGEWPENAIGSHTVIEPKMQQIMTDFQLIKHQFKGPGNPAESFIVLPHPLSMVDDPSRSIHDGEILITE
jgi:hypothetical protein